MNYTIDQQVRMIGSLIVDELFGGFEPNLFSRLRSHSRFIEGDSKEPRRFFAFSKGF